MVCYAVNLLPIKENVFQAFDVKEPSNKANKTMTLVIVLLSTTSAWLYKEVTVWLQLVGSFAGVMLAFTIPAICFVFKYKSKKGFELKAKLVSIWGFVISSLGLGASVVLILVMANVITIKDN
jgi:hypothetical protein